MEHRDISDELAADEQRRSIEQRLARIERRLGHIAGSVDVGTYRFFRRRLRPRLWSYEQYSSRHLRIRPEYRLEKPPAPPPRIAIVTPSWNQGMLIRWTVDSVLQQNYPNLAYLVQDGGSTDETTKVLASYGNTLWWRSGPDAGQANAINRAFGDVDGEIMGYLNSDDTLLPGTLAYVARAFRDDPQVDLVYGHRIYIDGDGFEIGRCVLPPHDPETLKWADYVPQETLFWRRRVWDEIGPFDESFDFALDWDFILRAQAAGFRFKRLPRFLACFRIHDRQKSIGMMDVGADEMRRLRIRSLDELPGTYELRRAIAPYLMRQVLLDWMYRLRLVRY